MGKAKGVEFYNDSDGIQHCVIYEGYKQMEHNEETLLLDSSYL